jgi:mRNA interferase RelE/StbE
MAWYRLTFQAAVAQDLATIEAPVAQRLFEKTKWLASNIDNLRHETIAPDMPELHKYAVGEWRIFYAIDRSEQLVDIHAIVHRNALRT